MKTRPSRMRGMSPLGWMTVLVIVVIGGSAAVKLIPAYLEYGAIIRAANNTLEDRGVALMSQNEIRRAMGRRMEIDNVSNLRSRDIPVTKDGNRIVIHLDYEVRESIIGNLDVVLVFKRDIEKTVSQ